MCSRPSVEVGPGSAPKCRKELPHSRIVAPQRRLKELLKKKEAISQQRTDVEQEIDSLERRRNKLKDKIAEAQAIAGGATGDGD